jgi:hypothetical protein
MRPWVPSSALPKTKTEIKRKYKVVTMSYFHPRGTALSLFPVRWAKDS